MLELVCVEDRWGYAVELLMPDRSRVRFQTKQDTGDALRHVSSDVPVRASQGQCTPQEDPISLKKIKLEPATREGPDIGQTLCQGRENRSNETTTAEDAKQSELTQVSTSLSC